MVRTQIQLTEKQSQKLKVLAARTGASVAELIRQGIDAVLERDTTAQPEDLRRRAIGAAGRYRSSRSDVSRRHDNYLGDAFGR
jgi:hypothetical protein